MSLEVIHKVACPLCSASLRSRKPIAVGTPLRCPGCKQSFHVGSSSTAITSSPATDAPVQFIPIDDPGKSNVLRLVLVGGVGMLGLVAAFLAWRLFAPDPPSTKTKKQGQPEQALVVSKPATPVEVAPLIALTADEEAKTKAAVQKGVAWLRAKQWPDGTWTSHGLPEGETAMTGLVLLEAGVPAEDPALKKAAAWLRATLSRTTHTYSLALTILFLDKLKDPQDEDLLREIALRLVAGQRLQGGWEYNCPTLTAGENASLLAMLNDTKGKDVAAHRRQHDEAWNRMPTSMRAVTALAPIPKEQDPFYFRQGGDNSNTQFALLGLWTARRHGVPVDAALERVVHRFRRSQKADGSWVYNHTTDVSSPTMTCAGLLALAVGTGLSDDRTQNAADSDAVKKAFRVVGDQIGWPGEGVKAPPPSELYFLWSVERVGVLYHKAQIEDKDWYRWGASSLLPNQRPEGFWHTNLGHGSSPLTDTCFAILFLQRANLATDLSDKLRRAAP